MVSTSSTVSVSEDIHVVIKEKESLVAELASLRETLTEAKGQNEMLERQVTEMKEQTNVTVMELQKEKEGLTQQIKVISLRQHFM